MASDNAKASRKISAPDASLSTKQAAAVDFQVKFERMCKYLKVGRIIHYCLYLLTVHTLPPDRPVSKSLMWIALVR